MVDKSSAFSIDAILAGDCSRSSGEVAGNHTAVIGDGGRGLANSMSVDDAWLRQLFSNVTRRLLMARCAADTRRSSSMICDKEPNMETEQSTDSISTMTESNSLHPRCFSSSVNSWLEQRRTPSFGCQISRMSSERRNRGHTEKLPPHHRISDGLHTSSVGNSGRQEHRLAETNIVDGRHRPQSSARHDVDAVNCYFDEESETEADDGTRAACSTGFYRGLHGDGHDESPQSHLNQLDKSTAGNHDDVEKDYSDTWTDSTLLWRLAHSKQRQTYNFANMHTKYSIIYVSFSISPIGRIYCTGWRNKNGRPSYLIANIPKTP